MFTTLFWLDLQSIPFQSIDFFSSPRNGVIIVGHTPSGSTFLLGIELIAATLLRARGTLHTAVGVGIEVQVQCMDT